MCDKDHFAESVAEYEARGLVTRRQFGVLLAAGAAMILPEIANAQATSEREVEIKTPDGTCDAYFVHPATGTGAGVIMFPDIVGLRPAFRGMGKRLAESGYSVVVVNPFYRTKAAPVVPDGSKFSDPAVRSQLMPLAGSLNPTTVVTDVTAFASWLDTQKSVNTRRKIGIMGYCMSGSYTIRGAAALPNRVGAGASFHGGGLTTKDTTSPHLLLEKTNASFLFAIADNDDKRDPESKNILRAAADAAKKSAEIEVYPAAHGWCPPDGEVYDKEQAEKAWSRMLALFGKALA